jgi:hypothetical protein
LSPLHDSSHRSFVGFFCDIFSQYQLTEKTHRKGRRLRSKENLRVRIKGHFISPSVGLFYSHKSHPFPHIKTKSLLESFSLCLNSALCSPLFWWSPLLRTIWRKAQQLAWPCNKTCIIFI